MINLKVSEEQLETILEALDTASYEYDRASESLDASGCDDDALFEHDRARACDDLEHELRKQVGR